MNPIETDAEVERAWVTALLDDHIDDQMHTATLKDERANYGSDANVMETIARSEINDMIVEKVYSIYAERTQAVVQT